MPHSVLSLGGHWSNLDIEVEDTASTLMNFSVDDKPVAVHLQQAYLQRPACRQCEIIGDQGKIVADFAGLRVTSTLGTRDCAGLERNQLFLDQIKHFLASMDGQETPVVDLSAGIQSLRMALAAKKSTTSGKPVFL